MIPGKSYPKPNGKVWVSAYTDSRKEYFEIRTVDPEDSEKTRPQWHYECTLGTGLADFAYEDLSWLRKHFEKVREHADGARGEDSLVHIGSIFDVALFWLHKSPVFAPFAAALERLQAEPCLDEAEAMIADYERLQKEVRFLLADCLETEQGENMAGRYMQGRSRDRENYPRLVYGETELMVNLINSRLPYEYDNMLDYMARYEKTEDFGDYYCTETLNCTKPQDLVYFLICRYLRDNVRFRVCKYCGRYFGITRNYKPEYCDRLIAGSTKTCKEAGSLKLYEKKLYEDPAIKEYKRSYKAHNARIRYGLMTREQFKAWSVEARQKRDQCLAGKLSLEDFIAWLDRDRI